MHEKSYGEQVREAAAKIAREISKAWIGRFLGFQTVEEFEDMVVSKLIEAHAMPLPEAPKDERPEIRVSDDGVWLGFAATSGRTAIVNIEGYAAELLNRTEGKSIIAAALNEWCQEQRRAAGWRRSP